MQLQHNPSFTNTFPICHGISWPQEAAFHTSDSREFSESLEKKYHSPKTFTFYSCLPHVCLHIVLLSCTVSWLGLKFDKLLPLHGDTSAQWLQYTEQFTRWCWDPMQFPLTWKWKSVLKVWHETSKSWQGCELKAGQRPSWRTEISI